MTMNIILGRINNVCNDVRGKCSEPTTFKQLLTKTRSSFKKEGLNLSIRTKREKDLDIDRFYVMAYYDSEEDAVGETPIEVVVHHNLTGTELFGPHQITNFLVEIYDAVAHEYRHQYQSMRRDFKAHEASPQFPYEVYLADSDEMDAYALSITIELLRSMDANRARRYMSRITVMSKMRTGSVYSSPVLRAYISHFGLSPVIKKLAKKIYKHLETVDKKSIFM